MVYNIMPGRYKTKIKDMLRYSGSKIRPKSFVNYTFTFSLLIGFIAALLIKRYFYLSWLIVFVAVFFLMHGFLLLAIERRAGFVENILPDALQLMAANSRAGYIPSRALLLSARKEFGPLTEAIRKSGKEMITGKSLEESLKIIPQNIKSNVLARTTRLIIEGVKSGGQFASLLEENAEDIRRIQAIKKDVKASIMMYTIFIGFAGCVGAPVLYALSSFLIGTIVNLGSAVSVPEDFASKVRFVRFGGLELSPDFLLLFSMAAITVTAVFGSMIIGLIGSGKEKNGIKYAPVLLIMAIVIFFLTKMVIGNMFGTLSME